MSSAQAVIRTAPLSIIGSQFLNTSNSLWPPTNPALAKGFIRQEIYGIEQSGNAVTPGTTNRFQIPRDVDQVTDIILRFDASGITVASWGGGATFARWVDFLGMQAWSQLVVYSGTQRLQVVDPLEIFVYIYFWVSTQQRRNIFRYIGQGTPAERDARSLADYEINCPIFTCMGLRYKGDPSQSFFVRGLNDFLLFNFTMRPVNQVVETDGATLPTQPANGWYQNGVFACNGYHMNNDERDNLIAQYAQMPYAIIFDDQQYATEIVIPAATTLPATITSALRNINQPLTGLFYFFRWQSDLQRTAPSAVATGGFDPWNVSGAFNAGGGNQGSIVNQISVFSGNVEVLSPIRANRLNTLQHDRDFDGDNNITVPAHSYSHAAKAVNAVLGFISFEQIDNPQVRVTLQVPTTGTAFATVGAASTADIGVSSDLVLQVVAFTKNEIDQANFLLSRPFN